MLSHFAGTEHYYRLDRQCLITDGVKYLADEAGANWLLDADPEFGIFYWLVRALSFIISASR